MLSGSSDTIDVLHEKVACLGQNVELMVIYIYYWEHSRFFFGGGGSLSSVNNRGKNNGVQAFNAWICSVNLEMLQC